MAATYIAPPLDSTPRMRLRQLDGVLDELEELNLKEACTLPVRVGNILIAIGLEDPYRSTITELIDLVFEEQAKVMTEMRAVPRFLMRRPFVGIQPIVGLRV